MSASDASARLALPPIARGRHGTPARGGCLMELTSLVAGELWSDHPQCVDPTLAAVARRVNDETGDEGRRRLLSLIPRLVGTAGAGTAAAAAVVTACARTALTLDTPRRPLTRGQRRRAEAALRTARYLAGHRDARPAPLVRVLCALGDPLRLPAPGYRRLVAPAVAAGLTSVVARAAGARCDTVLGDLLRRCVAAHGDARPADQPRGRPPADPYPPVENAGRSPEER
jgi:hypothetical protein